MRGSMVLRGPAAVVAGVLASLAVLLGLAAAVAVGAEPSPGPPFPAPEPGRAVYDTAGVFRPDTVARAETTIDAIEARTGAEVVVYTQLVPYGVTTDETESRAIALIDQWGVGRKGFDDGLAIFFDLDPSLVHGQVQLYAAPGFRATYLSNGERQAIYENDMLPLLKKGDLDGALLVALDRIDAAATPEHAGRLQLARQVDAAVGLVGAPTLFLLLVGWTAWSWLRFGRDPEYLDDPSILMPAPPPELTPAAGALVHDGRSSRRTLTTALLDLASRGALTFREDSGPLGIGRKVGVEVGQVVETEPRDEFLRQRAERRPLSPAEDYALRKLSALAADGYISPEALPAFGSSVAKFDEKLEGHVVDRGWFREPPTKTSQRWSRYAAAVLVAGAVGALMGTEVPSNGLLLLGGAAIAAAIVMFLVARVMPARTMVGAMLRAMLAAYRRTLERTLATARSMDQVVEEAALPWLRTPDDAVVWGVALGLQHEVEQVLERSVEDVRDGRAASGTYVPTWYRSGSTAGADRAGGGGLFSSSALPNVGGMMAALGTIGNSPSSGSGGGFGGGSSGGGGGGAGGGF